MKIIIETVTTQEILGDEAYEYPNGCPMFTKHGIEVVEISKLDTDIQEAIYHSGYGVPIWVVIKYKDKFYKSIGTYSSYGTDGFSEWTEVQQKTKLIAYYE